MTHQTTATTRCMNVKPILTDSGYSWWRLLCGMLIGVICNAALWTTISLLPSLQADFGLTRAGASQPYILTMAGFLVGSPFLGRMSDRFGITYVLIGASLLISFAYIAGGMAPNIHIFLVTQFIIGFGSSVGYAPLVAEISHWFRLRRGLALSLASSAGHLSGLFWTTVIAQVMQEGTWRDAYMVIGAGMLAVVPLSFLLRRRIPHYVLDAADLESARHADTARVSPSQIKWVLGVAGLGCCIAMAIPQIHIVALCGDLGFSIAQGNGMLSAMILAGIASRIVVGFVLDRTGAIPVLLTSSALQLLALFFYLRMDGLTSLYLVSVVFGFAQGGILPSYPMIVREYLPARAAGEVIGFISMWTMFGMAFGGWLSGWLYDLTNSYSVAFLNGIGWNALNIGLIGLLLIRTMTGRGQTANS